MFEDDRAFNPLSKYLAKKDKELAENYKHKDINEILNHMKTVSIIHVNTPTFVQIAIMLANEKAAKQKLELKLEEQEKDFQRQMKEFKSIQTEQHKCKEQEGASEKCEAQIEEIEREYDAEVDEAIDKFAKVTTLVIKASKKAIKCKRELRKLQRKCPY